MRPLTFIFFTGLFLSFSLSSEVLGQSIGTYVNMFGPAPRSTPNGCELIDFGTRSYDDPIHPDSRTELDAYFWFGCPSAKRPKSAVLWRVGENKQLLGEMRLGADALNNARTRLSSGETRFFFVMGSCTRRGDSMTQIGALVPASYEALEEVPVKRVIVAWIVKAKEFRKVERTELLRCEAG